MTDILDEYLDNLIQEYKFSTKIRVSRDAKVNRDIGSRSVKTAQKHNDILYKRMLYHREMYNRLKKQILIKYGSSVRMQARR